MVVVGGGFGGLSAAREVARAKVEVVLFDRKNHHLFQPLLYQVATAALAAPDIAAPIRRVLKRRRNVRVLMAEVAGIDLDRRVVRLEDGEVRYDRLILAVGAVDSYFGNDGWARHAPGLKSIDDAFEIRRKVLLAFEEAEREPDAARRRDHLTFVVVGGGPTGVELAGSLAEIARHTLARNFRNFDPRDSRVILIEGGDRVLPAFPEELSRKARAQLERLGVTVWTSMRVTEIDERGVAIGDERILSRCVLWAAGVKASPLTASLGVALDRTGRVLVDEDLAVPGHPEVFVVGDAAAIRRHGPVGGFLPGLAPVAIQSGRHAARNALATLDGGQARPFRYADKGMLATIGRRSAVAMFGRVRLAGAAAWILWLFVHIFFLIGFRNRFVVLFEWAWAYLSYQRSARVILRERRSGP